MALLCLKQTKNANDLFRIHAAAADHVIAVVADGVYDQLPFLHLMQNPLVRDVLDVEVNDVEVVCAEVGRPIRR